jgi:hypothetical protein
MPPSYFDVGEHTYFVVPSADPDGFVILHADGEVLDEDGEIPDDDAAFHCYATEREAEEAILRWKRREDDREGARRVIALFESYQRAQAEAPPK